MIFVERTRGLDIDFIKYSLENKSIVNFVNSLNNKEDDIKIKVVGKITALHHQDYDGKRVYIHIEDRYGNSVNTKLDIGVHKLFELEQDEYCFDLSLINKKVNLLINSKEQIFTEKLKSLLKLGFRSTRYKDIFDFYYLINMAGLDKIKLMKSIEILIINDESMREKSIYEITKRLDNIFKSPRYLNNLNNPEVNWLDISIDEAIETVVDYIDNLSDIKISV